jgi:hypothetical protein
VIRAEVGDTIKVVFRNNLTIPASIHPHGVFYTKSSEGAPYNDGTAGSDKFDDAVQPGQTYTYTWQVPDRAGPGPMDGSSATWLRHSWGGNVLSNLERRGLKIERSVPVHGVIEPFEQMVKTIKSKPR